MMTTRRAFLAGLLAAYPATAWPRGPAPEPRRSWPGSGAVTVLAVTEGDPRASAPGDDTEAALLAAWLVDGEDLVVRMSGVPDGETAGADLARALMAQRPGLDLREGDTAGFSDLQALFRVVRGLTDPNNPIFRARRLALADRALLADATENYLEQRGEAFARRDRVAADQQGRALLLASDLPRRALVITRALGAQALCDALEAAGRGGRLFATDAAAALIGEEPIFWSMFEAGLPPLGAGLAPWIEALRPAQAAMAAWPGRASFLAQIEQAVPQRPALEEALVARVQEASRHLERCGLPGLPADVALRGGAKPTSLMTYDSFLHSVQVHPSVAAMSLPLVAAALHHELTHVADSAEVAAALGVDRRGVMLLLDYLPPGIGYGVMASFEDHAYRVELEALDTIGLALPALDGALDDTPEGGATAFLAQLAAAGPGTIPWMALVDSTLGR
jgi:hypothetical protein